MLAVSFFARNLQIFKRIGLPLFVLTLFYTSIDQLLTINIEASLRSTAGGMNLVWLYGFLSLIFGILFPILGILIVIFGATPVDGHEKSLGAYLHHHINQLSIEILRSWGKTLLWSLLFILPGLWKYIQFTMIPFVVTLSRSYENGEKDALTESARIVQHHLAKVLGILVIFHLILPSVLTVFFDEYRLVWQTPIAALVLTLIDVYVFIFSTQLLIEVFEKEIQGTGLQEKPHAESYV